MSTAKEKVRVTEVGLYMGCGQIVDVVGKELVCRIWGKLSACLMLYILFTKISRECIPKQPLCEKKKRNHNKN